MQFLFPPALPAKRGTAGKCAIKGFSKPSDVPKNGQTAAESFESMKNEPKITPELVAAHGLKPDEYERILKLIGREPSFTE
ncbi:MAG: hypothetical protein JHD07_29080, partial [Bradyrhizobium sp.]|uniref:hypothetical protein n=1 Tax=Bradyrhizobium sp. TaxID=376 RepID=UPI001A2159BC